MEVLINGNERGLTESDPKKESQIRKYKIRSEDAKSEPKKNEVG